MSRVWNWGLLLCLFLVAQSSTVMAQSSSTFAATASPMTNSSAIAFDMQRDALFPRIDQLSLTAAAAKAPKKDIGALLQKRGELAEMHKYFAIATWGAMTVTTAMGFIQMYNKYGFFAGQGSNPCVKGDAVFGQGMCSGKPWIHLAPALATTALYTTTGVLAWQMPDPLNASEGNSDYAKNLSLHKTLRWVHMGGMIAQILFGMVMANSSSFGIDRANDYGTLQALSMVHTGIGLVTWGAFTWAGSLMIF